MNLYSCTGLALALASTLSFSVISAENTNINDTFEEVKNQAINLTSNTINNEYSTSEANVLSKSVLIEKLAAIEFFSGDFTQQVFDTDNHLIQEGAGTMSVDKPNKVHWKTNTPEESLIVSNGETLWFYDPFIEQVSVYALESAVVNTPILLLTNESDAVWLDYDISEPKKNTFKIVAKNAQNQSQIQSLIIAFSDTEKTDIKAITINDITGQRSEIKLHNMNYTKELKSELFNFVVPEGVFIDDQR